MEPLRLPRVNLFIADDTGLGKTIEAALIAHELLPRKKAKTIVVAASASVLEQWKGELEDRFGLIFEILDRGYLARMRRDRGFGVNPWRTHSRFLISHNLLIDPAYTDPMREWLSPMLPGSLLILDEAHHAAPSSGGRYVIETKFTRVIRDLGARFEHRLFLSATPHNGHSNSLRELGGARRILEEQVQNTLKGYGSRRRLGEKEGLFRDRRNFSEVMELTSRVSTDKVALARHLRLEMTPAKEAGQIAEFRAEPERQILDIFNARINQQPIEDREELNERRRSIQNRVVDLLDSWRKIYEDYLGVNVELQYQKYELKQPGRFCGICWTRNSSPNITANSAPTALCAMWRPR